MNQSHPPVNEPYIREWEISENSTHYDRMVAAPSDWEMEMMWRMWSVITGVVVTVVVVVFLGVLSSRKARGNPFNLYLLFLMIPDICFSLGCFVTCTLNASVGHYYSEFACYFQSYYLVFGISANAWMNALVARELYTVLLLSFRLRKLKAPKKGDVIRNSIVVYMGSACVAGMGVFQASWWPHKTRLLIGTACMPTDYDTRSTIFFYCVYFPTLLGIPMGYVLYCCYRIYRGGLLPKTGKRRLLTVYFLRLTAVFLIMWLPGILLFFVVGGFVHYWVAWAGAAWGHLQGLVSALVSLMKPDVYQAVSKMLHCNFSQDEDDANTANGYTNRTVNNKSSFSTWSRIHNFSEIVGRKTQVQEEEEEHHEAVVVVGQQQQQQQQLPSGDLEEQQQHPDKMDLDRRNMQQKFSEAVGLEHRGVEEPLEVYTGDEANIESSPFLANELASEGSRQQKLSQSSDDEYNPKVNFFETDVGKYYS